MTDLLSGISFAVQMLHPCLLKIHYLPLNLKLSSRRNQIDLVCLDRANKKISGFTDRNQSMKIY